MKSSDSAAPADTTTPTLIDFTCNLCGQPNRAPESQFDREVGSCTGCGSTVRTRAVVQMISRELLGFDLTLPEFPVLKGITGIGMSDSPDYAERLAAKFSYTNTYYHKEPAFDIGNVPESEAGSYDFLIASEVFEHVAPPVEIAFQNAFRLLKPNGLFFFTVPYTLDQNTVEHFPELHDYGIVQLSDRHVLVNRTRDGRLEVFEDLLFHGGPGETLELRRFTERDLRALFLQAGFQQVEVYGKNYAPFGILRPENWSLPMTARKQPFALELGSIADLMEQSAGNARRLTAEVSILKNRVAEYEGQMQQCTAWARDLERQFEERTQWALSLEKDLARHMELAKKFQAEWLERTEWALKLQAEVAALQQRLDRLNASPWTKAGRLLRFGRD